MVLPAFFMMGGSYTTSQLLGDKRSSKRSSKRSPKRSSKRSTTRSSKRSTRRTARRSSKRTTRRSTRRSTRRTAKRSTRRTAKKIKKCPYKGNEPSPKGFGNCARNTPLGTKMEGKDGNIWTVKKFSKGKRWVKN